MPEVFEETGLNVELVGEKREDVEDPVQLHRPAGVQLENIGPRHQHIDLIYFARPAGSTEIKGNYSEDKVGWYAPEDWDQMAVNAEVRGWCERALAALSLLETDVQTSPDRLRVRAVAAVAAVGADELAMQTEHLCPAQLALFGRPQRL